MHNKVVGICRIEVYYVNAETKIYVKIKIFNADIGIVCTNRDTHECSFGIGRGIRCRTQIISRLFQLAARICQPLQLQLAAKTTYPPAPLNWALLLRRPLPLSSSSTPPLGFLILSVRFITPSTPLLTPPPSPPSHPYPRPIHYDSNFILYPGYLRSNFIL